MKSRFILCGLVNGSDKVSDFRLVCNVRRYCGGYCIRVNIPDDMEISTFPGDGYSVTSDNRILDDLGWDCYIVFNGEWRKFNWLKCLQPHEWYLALEYIFGFYNCHDDICYTSDYEYYKKWYKDRICGNIEFKKESEIIYPKFKKNVPELICKPNLKPYPFNREYEKDKEWYKLYKDIEEGVIQ